MNTIALSINVCTDDWTTDRSTIASNAFTFDDDRLKWISFTL